MASKRNNSRHRALNVERLEFRQLLAADILLLSPSTISLPSGNAAIGNPADFNNDGILDLVATSEQANKISVLLGQGNGGFAPSVQYAVGQSPSRVKSADINGDNKLDLLVSNFTGNSISILRGKGNGEFEPAQTMPSFGIVYDVDTGDFNQDGIVDIVSDASGNGTNGAAVYLGSGAGVFQNPVYYPTGGGSTNVVVADMDNDGVSDLLKSNYFDNTVGILYGNKDASGRGNGTFGSLQLLGTGLNVFDLVAKDFNSDGKLDIATANRGDGTSTIYLGLGNRQFAQPSSLAIGPPAFDVQAADLNQDGQLDLVFASVSGNQVSLFAGTGNGTFEAKGTFGQTFAMQLALADLNGDGNIDVLSSSAATGVVQLRLNAAAPASPHLSISAPTAATFANPFPVTIEAKDSNGLTATNFTGTVQFKSGDQFAQLPADYTFTAADQGVKTFSVMFKSTGNQTISATLIGSNGIVSGKVVSVAPPVLGDISLSLVGTDSAGSGNVYLSRPVDYNGDGILDMATANNGNNTLNIYLGTNTGLFSLKATIPTQGVDPYGSDSGDFNGDGILDIAVSNLGTSSISVFQGVGNGTFNFMSSLTSLPGTYHLTVTDLDADGKADIAANQTSPSGIVVFRGLGNGDFNTRDFYATGEIPTNVYAADIDNDGAKDLLTSTYFGNTVSILYGLKSVAGNPTGSFGVSHSLPFSSGAFDLSISDFDGDGWKDIATANRSDGTGSIFRGLGNRQFMQLPSLSVGAQPYSVQAADLNNDGVPDLVFNSLTEGKFTVWAGLGNGEFEQKLTLPVTNAYRIALADFDGNGTTDMLGSSAGNGQFRSWLNSAITTRTTLSLLAPASARFGSPVSVTVSALSPNGSVDTAFTGTIQFKSSDRFAQLPADYTFTAADQGVKTFSVMFKSTGNQTISATLIGSNGIVSGKVVSVAPPVLGDISLSLVGTDSAGSGNVYLSRPVDYNGDGILDMATANNGNNTLNIYLGTNTGLFSLKATIPTQGVDPYGSDSGDFNGDGILDIAVSNLGTSSISVFQGVGNGTFNFMSSLTSLPGTYHLTVTDLDADGKADIAANQTSPSGIVVFRGLGNGDFNTRDFYATGEIPTNVYAADIDNDGAKDLLTSTYFGNTVSILYGLKSVAGNPTGSFGVSHSLPFSSGAFDLSISDFDGDGWKDIATANRSDGTGSIFRGLGNRQFMQLPSLSVGAQPYSVQAADLNNDGVPDLVFNSLTEGKFTVWAGLGNGEFEQKLTLPVTNAYRIALADFDGNGTTDMLGSSAGNGQFRSWLNSAITTRTTLSLLAPASARFGSPVSVTVSALSPNGSVDTAFTGTIQFKSNDRFAQLPSDYTFTAADQGVKTFTVTLQSYGSQTISAALVGANGVVSGKIVSVGLVTADDGGPYSVAAGTALFLDGTKSSSGTSQALTYQWDLDYDGLAFQADTAGRTALFDASQMVGGQQRTVALRVTDSAGFSDTSVTIVSVVGLNSELDGAPLATEELVNTTTSRDQMFPALAMNKTGQSVVVYESGSNGTIDLDILAQRYNATGAKDGGESQVNFGASAERIRPGVAMADDGRYVVAWQGWGADAQGWGINAQRFDKDGNRVGNQFIVNVGWESGYQVEVDLAISPDGTKFVVVWEDSQNDGSGQGVFASLFDWDSNLPNTNNGLLNTRLVSNYTSGAQDSADVEMLANGGFVVTWASQYQDGSDYGIFARRFDASGNPINPNEIQINRFTEGTQTQPDLATTRDGQEYVITWQTALNNRATDIVAQRFDSNFDRIGAEFIVNESSAGTQYSPAVAIASNGFTTFTWSSPGQDGSGFGIFARTMGPGTNEMGHEFQINSVSVGDQNTRGSRQSIAYTPTGETVVTWWGNGPGDDVGVFQRRFVSGNRVVSPITDENTSSNQSAENSVNGSDVGIRAFALDPDLHDTITYSLDDSAGNRFAINETNGVITVSGAIDRETAASYNVVVRATSTDSSFTTKAFTISVTDVDEFDTSPIADTNTLANTVPENSPNGTLVHVTAFASDADATNNGITYSLDNSAGGRFAIDPATGVVQVAGAIDYETSTSHTIVTRATSADGSFSTASFVISVQDVNEGIVFTGTAGNDTLKFWPGPSDGQFYFKRNAEANVLFTANGSVTINGGGGTDTLVIEGTNLTNQFDIYANRVRYSNVDFYSNQIATRQINALGSGDTINAYGGSASVNGGSAVDTLVALTPGNQVWSLTAPNAGNLNGQIFFTSVESLIGSDGNDQFLIGPSGSVSGRIDGGIGLNTLDYSNVTTALSFNLQTGAATKTGGTSNIAHIIGGSAIDTLTAANGANLWTIGGGGSGTINNSFSFNGLENLVGGSLSDVFTIGNTSLVTGNLNGGGGVDSIAYQSNENLLVNLASSTASKISGTISSIEQIALGTGTDTVVGRNVTSNWNVTGPNAITTSGVAFQNVETLVGGSGLDTLIGTAQNNQWNLDGSNAGRLEGLAWSGVENLTGGTGDDAFSIAASASVSGIINGGNGLDFLDYRGFGASVVVDLSFSSSTGVGKFTSISTIFGSAANDRIIGADNANSWSFTASGGVVDGLAFDSFENWQGGSGTDSFSGPNAANIWLVTGANSGSVADVIFDSMENLIGNSQLDTFAFQGAGSISGQINGGLGEDVLDYSGAPAAVVVNLFSNSTSTIGSFTSISMLIGSAANDTLVGVNNASTWTITSPSTFTVNSLRVGNVESLVGGTGVDVFRAKEGVEYFGSIDGGTGVDRVEYTTFASSVSVNLGLGTATGFASVSRIENITGGNSDDFLVGDAFDNVISGGNGDDVLLGMAGNDILNGSNGRDLLFGGSGADQIRGNNSEDILIGGLTNYAQEVSGIVNRAAVDAIMLEWRRTDSTYAQRIARLRGTAQGGLNGAYFLNAASLIDDKDVDDLWGDAGLDWFWAGLDDIVHFTSGEDVENL